MTKHTRQSRTGCLDAVLRLLRKSDGQMIVPRIAERLGYRYSHRQIGNALTNLTAQERVQRHVLVKQVGIYRTAYSIASQPEPKIIRPQSRCLLQEVWK